MPGQNFINGPPNPRGVERTTLDGKIRIEDQSDFSILKITGLKFLVVEVISGKLPAKFFLLLFLISVGS